MTGSYELVSPQYSRHCAQAVNNLSILILQERAIMRLISFTVYFAILPIFNAVVAAPVPIVSDVPNITVTPPQEAQPHSSQHKSASFTPNRLGGSAWTGNKSRHSQQHLAIPKPIARTNPGENRVSKREGSKKPLRGGLREMLAQQPERNSGQQHQVAPYKQKGTQPKEHKVEGMLAGFQKMSITHKAQGSREVSDQEMSNT